MKDEITGLVWQRVIDANTQYWWQAAMDYCSQLILGEPSGY